LKKVRSIFLYEVRFVMESTEECTPAAAAIEGENSSSRPQENLEDDPYAYLDRSDFSSEKFKIEIKNLPKIYGINVREMRVVFVSFSN
jgi:hypothetical protein